MVEKYLDTVKEHEQNSQNKPLIMSATSKSVSSKTPVSIGIIGSGHRGGTFINELVKMPELARISAICDVSTERMKILTTRFGLKDTKQFTSLDEMLAGNLVEAVIVTVPDNLHRWAAVKIFEAGKDVMLEKPLAPTAEDCRAILQAHRRSGRLMQVGFVLRSTSFYRRVKAIVDSGVLGQIMFIHACEYLGVQHGASYMTRWHRKRENAGTFLLAKCSHDLDILNWLTGSKPQAVASFGGNDFFLPERGGAAHCSECERTETCPYQVDLNWHFITGETRPPGSDLCAFNDDKDVIDNQVVILEYANRIRATFELQLFHPVGGRRITIGGQYGYLEGDFEAGKITIHYNTDGRIEEITLKAANDSGHGGGDFEFTRSFVRAIRTRETNSAGAEAGLAANVIAEAVEQSRLKKCVVPISLLEYAVGSIQGKIQHRKKSKTIRK